MPRVPRAARGGIVYHVLNRANARMTIFENDVAFAGFEKTAPDPVLSEGPEPWPRNWLGKVNAPQTDEELAALRLCVARGRPFGPHNWVDRMARRLGLESTLRPPGRPTKPKPQTHPRRRKVKNGS